MTLTTSDKHFWHDAYVTALRAGCSAPREIADNGLAGLLTYRMGPKYCARDVEWCEAYLAAVAGKIPANYCALLADGAVYVRVGLASRMWTSVESYKHRLSEGA